MKKKLLISFVAVLSVCVIFSSTGLAEVVKKQIEVAFGTYTVQVDGKKQKTETLDYDGKVYVPISDVSKLTGSTVKQSKNTINITSGETKIKKLKLMAEYQNTYENIENLGESFILINSGLGFAFDEYDLYGTTKRLYSLKDNYDHFIDVYNDQVDNIDALEKRAKSEGYPYIIDHNLLNKSLGYYYDSFKHFENAYDNVESFTKTNDKKYYDAYTNESSQFFDLNMSGKSTAREGYEKYAKAIRNFK